MSNAILEMRNITKTFPGVIALDDVTLVVERGEIHAICGENGAGKSTLRAALSRSISFGIFSRNDRCELGVFTPELEKDDPLNPEARTSGAAIHKGLEKPLAMMLALETLVMMCVCVPGLRCRRWCWSH